MTDYLSTKWWWEKEGGCRVRLGVGGVAYHPTLISFSRQEKKDSVVWRTTMMSAKSEPEGRAAQRT